MKTKVTLTWIERTNQDFWYYAVRFKHPMGEEAALDVRANSRRHSFFWAVFYTDSENVLKKHFTIEAIDRKGTPFRRVPFTFKKEKRK